MPSIAQLSPASMKKRKRDIAQFNETEVQMKMNRYRFKILFRSAALRQKQADFAAMIDSPRYISPPLYDLSHQGNRIIGSPKGIYQPPTALYPKSRPMAGRRDFKRQRIILPSAPTSQYHDDETEVSLTDTPQSPNSTSYSSDRHGPFKTSRPQHQHAGSGSDLSACHICHRKPRVRSELDSYANCEGCGQRTCYVCMRQCSGDWSANAKSYSGFDDGVEGCPRRQIRDGDGNGMDERYDTNKDAENYEAHPYCTLMDEDRSPAEGEREKQKFGDSARARRLRDGTPALHKDMICSRCCIERGTDGEVRCLGCLRAEEEN